VSKHIRIMKEGTVVFDGELEVVPVVNDLLILSGGQHCTVMSRKLYIDLKGIEPTKIILFTT